MPQPNRIFPKSPQSDSSSVRCVGSLLAFILVVVACSTSAAVPGTVVAWGAGTVDNYPSDAFQKGQSIVPAGAQDEIIAIAAGDFHSVALRADGTVIAWGAGDYPRFSMREKAWEYGQALVPVAAQSGIQAIAAGVFHTLALKTDGSVVAWGAGTLSVAVDPDFGQAIVPAAALSDVMAIAAGNAHSLALKSSGEVVGWGFSRYRANVIPADATKEVIAIAAGDEHSLALKADGSVIAWGAGTNSIGIYPYYGQSIVPAAARSGVVAIAAGGTHSMALKTNGTVVAWGDNSKGQRNVPVSAQTGVIAIAAGYSHSVALKTNGVVIVWGDKAYGQTSVPPGIQGSVIKIAAGGFHTLAIVAEPDPTIGITRGAAEIKISWPASPSGFVPQAAPTPGSDDWQAAAGTIVELNGTNTLTVPTHGDSRFFRLFKP